MTSSSSSDETLAHVTRSKDEAISICGENRHGKT